MSPLGKALVDDRERCDAIARATMSDIVLAEPVTAVIAIHPDVVEQTESLQFHFNSLEGVDMLSVEAEKLFDVERAPQEGRTVDVVKTFKDPESMRRQIIEHVARVALPGLDAGQFWKIMGSKLSPEDKAKALAKANES